jgi:hypothetical protein
MRKSSSGRTSCQKRLDLGHLGEEAVAAEVEAPAVALHRAADPADRVGGLQDGRLRSGLPQADGGGEPGRAGADDDDRVVGRACGRGRGVHAKVLLSSSCVRLVAPHGRSPGARRRAPGPHGDDPLSRV